MKRGELARARRAWEDLAAVDEEVGELIDGIYCQPRAAASIPQLETAAAHLRAAKRLLIEVQQREAPLYREGNCA